MTVIIGPLRNCVKFVASRTLVRLSIAAIQSDGGSGGTVTLEGVGFCWGGSVAAGCCDATVASDPVTYCVISGGSQLTTTLSTTTTLCSV